VTKERKMCEKKDVPRRGRTKERSTKDVLKSRRTRRQMKK
jgi:hypothetical protein